MTPHDQSRPWTLPPRVGHGKRTNNDGVSVSQAHCQALSDFIHSLVQARPPVVYGTIRLFNVVRKQGTVGVPQAFSTGCT